MSAWPHRAPSSGAQYKEWGPMLGGLVLCSHCMEFLITLSLSLSEYYKQSPMKQGSMYWGFRGTSCCLLVFLGWVFSSRSQTHAQ